MKWPHRTFEYDSEKNKQERKAFGWIFVLTVDITATPTPHSLCPFMNPSLYYHQFKKKISLMESESQFFFWWTYNMLFSFQPTSVVQLVRIASSDSMTRRLFPFSEGSVTVTSETGEETARFLFHPTVRDFPGATPCGCHQRTCSRRLWWQHCILRRVHYWWCDILWLWNGG